MNGAESLARTLADSGVEICFANPGTSEIHMVAAMGREKRLRGVLCLFEGVATGAADGYGRMAGMPAATLLHLGPGLANGLANLHNAKRAGTPLVNIVGDHASSHAAMDAPLASDIAALARPVSAWVHTSVNAEAVAGDGARAVQAARAGGIATLILPADAAWGAAKESAAPLPVVGPAPVPSQTIDAVAGALLNGKKTAILMRGASLSREGLEAAGRIAARSGARLLCDTFTPRLARGAGIVAVERLPYFAEQAIAFLKDVEQLILVGAKPPVSFFATPGQPGAMAPANCEMLCLATKHEDGIAALQAVAEAIAAPKEPALRAAYNAEDFRPGKFNAHSIGQIMARHLPEGAILCEEAATSAAAVLLHTANARAHDVLSLTGGAIGQCLPLATGAALACPGRKVVALSGDGGAMYTLQALWTQAREKLDVTTVICANRSYAILNVELARFGLEANPQAVSMLDLRNPQLDWTALARGLGVEATRAETADAFAAQFADAMKQKGPRLIEAVI
ncbi:MAG TPA: acetolactate synthase large subunit [Rhizomicrobium sp.]